MIHIIYSIVTAIALSFSLWSPLGDFIATPKFWRDEAIPFEIARTFSELGKLDVVVAPGQVDGRPYLTHATGFPLTIPLAGVFEVFGVGVRQARIFMIAWILAAIWFLIFFLRTFWGEREAFAGALLISTFAPFYANGRTFTGEIPGFLFLLVSLLLIYKRKNYFWGGFALALAAVTKPSVFLLVFPALFLEFLWAERKNFWRPLLRIAAGSLPMLLVWLYIILPNPFSLQSLANMIDLYRHPFNEPSMLTHPWQAVKYLFTHSTILYFGFLAALIAWAYRRGAFQDEKRRVVNFMFVYGVFSIMYFLRSPGWFRYLLISELFALMLVLPSFEEIFEDAKRAAVFFIGVLVVVQSGNYFFFSNIPSGLQSIRTAEALNRELSSRAEDATVGIIYNSPVAALIASNRKYQIATIGGRETYGIHPLSLPEDKLPLYLVGYNGEYKETFGRFYELYDDLEGGQKIYKKK